MAVALTPRAAQHGLWAVGLCWYLLLLCSLSPATCRPSRHGRWCSLLLVPTDPLLQHDVCCAVRMAPTSPSECKGSTPMVVL